MKPAAVERAAIPEFIFGDQLLHARFSTAIELIASIVMAHPRSVTGAGLAQALGQPLRQLRPLLLGLQRTGLIEQDPDARDTWTCRPGLGRITLADVFCSVADVPAGPGARGINGPGGAGEDRSGACQSVDLLLMQATMAINQVVFQSLQAFDLERLRALGRGTSIDSMHAGPRLRMPEPV